MTVGSLNPTGDNDQLPLAVLLPDSAAGPSLIYDTTAALVMAVVDRHAVEALENGWDVLGVYVLLDRHDSDGTWGCYVGKAPAGVRSRLKQHTKAKEHWQRALLVRRDTTFGFNSAHVGWLEGRLYDLLNAAADTRLHNGNRPSDETLPPYERAALETLIPPIRRVLRLLGHETDTPDDATVTAKASTPKTRSTRFYGITVRQLFEDSLLTAGETLTSTNTLWPATATLTADGSISVGGVPYSSPSKAAGAIKMGAVNGWEFWSVKRPAGRTPLATVRATWLESQEKASITVISTANAADAGPAAGSVQL